MAKEDYENYLEEQKRLGSETIAGAGSNAKTLLEIFGGMFPQKGVDIPTGSKPKKGEDYASVMESQAQAEEERITGAGNAMGGVVMKVMGDATDAAKQAKNYSDTQNVLTDLPKTNFGITPKKSQVENVTIGPSGVIPQSQIIAEEQAKQNVKKTPGYESGWTASEGGAFRRTTQPDGTVKIEGRGLGSPGAYAGGGGGVGGAGLDKKIEDLIDRVSSQKSLYADIELTKALVGEKGARERAMIGLEGTKYGADASRVTAEERAADRQLARDELNFHKEQDRKMRERTASDETIKSFSIMRNGKQGPRELGLLRMGLSGMTIDEFNLPAVQLELKKYYAKRDAFKKQREAAGKDFDEELFLRDYEKIYGVEE